MKKFLLASVLLPLFLNCGRSTHSNSKPREVELKAQLRNSVLLGVVMPVYGNPTFVRSAFESIKAAMHGHKDLALVIVNDGSPSESVNKLWEEFPWDNTPNVILLRHEKNMGVLEAIKTGLRQLRHLSPAIMCNLDSDVIIKKETFDVLIDRVLRAPEKSLVTGFNTPNHPALGENSDYLVEKLSIGGVNICYRTQLYDELIASYLDWIPKADQNAWDWLLVAAMHENRYRIYATKPSVVQHIGAIGMHSDPLGSYDFDPNF